MKKTALSAALLCSLLLAAAQKRTKPEEAFFLLDEKMNSTNIEKAKYLVHSTKKNDTCWLFDTYNMYGPIISSAMFRDTNADTLHGETVYFNKKGTRDSIGHYFNGLRHGSFYYLNDTGRTYIQKDFEHGVLVATIDRIKKDAADEAEWKRKNDSVKQEEQESDFRGGQSSWIRYLNKNLVYPERARQLAKEGTVVVQFIVDTEGRVFDPQIVQSVEFSLDQETIRIITISPPWAPAVQKGKKVTSYKKQPLTYRLNPN